jgi:prolyl oligopeptidase
MSLSPVAGALALALALGSAAAQSPEPGAAGADPYLFLENAASPETQAFYREQASRTEEQLARLPGRAAMLARVRALSESATEITALAVTSGPRVFYLKLAPRLASPVLCMRESMSGAERVLVDPERFSGGAGRASIDWFAPSPDGHHVAYGVSIGGSEDSVLRVVATDGGRDLPLEINRARFNHDLAWHPDGRSFYYARVPEGQGGARRDANVRIYRHMLGRDTARDEIVFAAGVGGARDVPEFGEPSLHVPLESRYAYAIARDGVRREIAVHVTDQRDLAAGRPHWRKLAGPADAILAIEGWKDDLYLLSHRGSPRRRVLRVKGDAHDLSAARVAVPQGDTVIEEMALARDALYLRTMVGGVDRLERAPIGLLGNARAPEYVRVPFDNAILQLVAHPRTPGAFLRTQGWIEPPMISHVDVKGELRNTRLQPPPAADFSAIDEVRLYAPAPDGTKIPVTLIYRKSTTLTGGNPTLLVGYGSYGRTLRPSFDPARLAWLDRGGVYAIAHVRGGGEYGEPWHEAGRGAAKLNTINDFIAVSEFLVSYGFTSAKRLAIQGCGAGAIPAGGALVRRPDLYAAVVACAPLMDMLRYETMASGPANVPEFGSAATREGREALREISAYHQVKDGAPYPAVMLTAGLNDPRIEPWQPGKMAARLQAATPGGKPVLLRVGSPSGHGPQVARGPREEELADIYSFLLWHMGDPQFQPPAPPAAVEVPASPALSAPSASEPVPNAAAPAPSK